MMKYSSVVLAAVCSGLLSFSLLAVAIGTDYWYIIDVNKPNHTGPDELSSHSGLWRIYEGANRSAVIPSFTANMSSLSEVERHLLGLHKVVVILLPLSLVLLVLGWILGLVSSLACSPKLLAGSATYFLICSLFTLSGVSVYIKYSNHAMDAFQQIVSPENLAYVDVSFGWSLTMAWLSYSLEVATGLLLMLAATITQMKGRYDSGVAIAML
ncbi:transmembrane protein 235-like [Solea senegalensis]|uniref:Transmembrane protein 235-like n=1 Tax=Solea senegalensis TaxID=28829 RepID=A0AAV6RIY1_SOLSE|nr:transmembrane protein 235-like [Solea senegalensis]XP_058509778.1 transmembrane protein 235-like [Solea solea]KAG7505451.1 transmembrane protein 235-like [Solea senegalensis]